MTGQGHLSARVRRNDLNRILQFHSTYYSKIVFWNLLNFNVEI